MTRKGDKLQDGSVCKRSLSVYTDITISVRASFSVLCKENLSTVHKLCDTSKDPDVLIPKLHMLYIFWGDSFFYLSGNVAQAAAYMACSV